jgi:hypothetical protein
MSGFMTFDLGAAYLVDRGAVWADEFAGFGLTHVTTSLDGVSFGLVVAAFSPTNRPALSEGGPLTYGADLFAMTPTVARYVRFQIHGAQFPREYDGLGIGEVAFRVSTVPEPASAVLIALGVLAAARARSRRSRP